MLLLIFIAFFILFYYWYICLCHRVMVTEQFPYFAGMTRKRLPSFGDETLILFFNSAFNFLNDILFVACLLRLCLRAFHFDPLCYLSLSIFVIISSVVSWAGSCLLGGLNHALIYRIHTTRVSFPDRKWHDASKPVARFSLAQWFWMIREWNCS